MTENVIKLQHQPTWLASFDLYRYPDGQLCVRLVDARTSVVEAEPTASADKLLLLANWIQDGLDRMRANAQMIG